MRRGDGTIQCSAFRLLFSIGSSTWLSAILLLYYVLQEGIHLQTKANTKNDQFALKPHSWCSKQAESHKQSKKESPLNVLLFCSIDCTQIGHLLEEWGIFYSQRKAHDKAWNDLESGFHSKRVEGRGTKNANFNAIIFESIHIYNNLSKNHKKEIQKYCLKHSTGILFVNSQNDIQLDTLPSITYTFESHNQLRNIQIVKSYSILQSPKVLYETLDASNYASISTSTSTSFPLLQSVSDGRKVNLVIKDQNIVIFGSNPFNHWLFKFTFIDVLFHFSPNGLGQFDRYVLIDIDDIFVGKNRLNRHDVEHLIESQKRIKNHFVDDFKYNLGFSGANFQNKIYSKAQRDGDLALVEFKDEFLWFPHTYRHLQPHLFNTTKELVNQMTKNKNFALKYGIKMNQNYAVSPHHSGVYPLHVPLFEAWKSVWNISVTSTEEYPHLRPARSRRGFVYNGVSVLPRQTCGLFTKNIYYADYPRSPEVLEKSLYGGELPYTMLSNPINIFMTHMPNYGFDRLAPYAFESAFSFLNCWTRVRLRTVSPVKLAEIYFDMFPEEKAPIWGNPCNDPRHKEIWSPNKSCNKFPDFIIIGPQKTGTTALHSFLKLHPSIQANQQHPKTFEELQFFSNNAEYLKGIDHYSSFFDEKEEFKKWNFEKSATYFDKEIVAQRAFRLLPDAKIVALIISPSKRALSWYHHAKAHQDAIALNYSFYEVITANASNHPHYKAMKGLQSRILEPGKYVLHLRSWLKYYHDVFILNGDDLRNDPVSLLKQLQVWLGIRPVIDYGKLLVYDNKKGFFCQRAGARNKCLGKNKGREYPPMSVESERFLKSYYREFNLQLKKLLYDLDFSIPAWLMVDE